MSNVTETTGPSAASYVAVAVVAVLIGALLAPHAASFASGLVQGSPDAVAVVPIDGPITSGSADAIRDTLAEVRENESYEAVVLDVNSPGGTVAASESLYLAVDRTAEEMPVVASVDETGASGAYMAMLPADRIYVKPGSLVGSVGVIASPPAGSGGFAITSGPDKGSGYTDDEILAIVETMRKQFVSTVVEERGDRLELSAAEVSNAKIYAGASAVGNGMADRIGDQESAIAHAAELAGVEDYAVVEKEVPRSSGILLLSATTGDTGTTAAVRGDPFGHPGVDTTQLLALYGQPEGTEVITDDE